MAKAARRTPAKKTTKVQGQRTAAATPVAIGEDPAAAAPILPKLSTSPPFFYAYHPHRWTVLEGHVIPALGKLTLGAAIDQVRLGGGGRIYWREAATAWANRGWTVIPHDAGPGGKTYLNQVEVRGGLAHVSCFTLVYPGSDNIGTDADAYAAWVNSLFDDGVLDVPQKHALEALRAQVEARFLQVADKVATSPSMKTLADRFSEDIKAIDAYIAALPKRFGAGSDAAPTPVATAAASVVTE